MISQNIKTKGSDFALQQDMIFSLLWWHTSDPYMQDKLCQHSTIIT